METRKQGELYVKFVKGIAGRGKGWGAWFRGICRTLRETGAEILEHTVEEDGHVRIKYLY